jgi:glycoside/pentoside/hexuronide:cation symporter, GPH family
MASLPSSIPAKENAVLSDRVPIPQKIGYGLGSFLDMWGHWLYQAFANLVFNIYLGVPPGLVSTALGINRLWDAFSDPLFGWASDNTRSRFGRRRPFILVGGLLAGMFMPGLYAVSQGWTSHQYFIFMLISSAIYVPMMSCFNMAWVSLGSEMTPNYNERTLLMSIRNAIQKAPELAQFFAGQFTTMAVWVGADMNHVSDRIALLLTSTDAWKKAPEGSEPNILLGAQVYAVILGVIMMICAVLMFFLLRERYYQRVVDSKQEKIPITDTLTKTMRCKPFRYMLVMIIAYTLGTSMVGILGFYDTIYYVCKGDVSLGSAWNFKMGVAGMVLGFAGIPFYTMISKWFGKRHAMGSVLVMAIAAFVGDWFFYAPEAPQLTEMVKSIIVGTHLPSLFTFMNDAWLSTLNVGPWLQLLACGCVAFTGAGFWTIYNSMLADIMDYDELETGKRREGAFSACQSWLSKVGMTLGSVASGWILQLTGFHAELKALQAPHAIFWMRFMLSAIPVIFLIAAVWAIFKFPLTRDKMADIRAKLEEKRGKV